MLLLIETNSQIFIIVETFNLTILGVFMNQLATVDKSIVDKNQEWNRERIDLVKTTFCKGATDEEFSLFIGTCKRLGLSPEARQVFAVKRYDSTQRKEAMTIQISIDGFRLVAERSGKYGGQLGPLWCGKDGKWKDVWLDDAPPAAAKVGVVRNDWQEPVWAVARFESYKQTTRQGDLTKMWQKMNDLMLAKCAESLALRKAFPQSLSGLYTSDELSQSNNPQVINNPKPHPVMTKQDRLEKMLLVFTKIAQNENLEAAGDIRYVLEDYCDSRPFESFGETEFKKLQGLYSEINSGKITLQQVCEKLHNNKKETQITEVEAAIIEG